MPKQRKIYKTKIQDAEDFGLFFNCLTRRYLWDYDEELLDLILRIIDRYLPFFSARTLICSIRDLAEGKDGVFCECHKDKPEDQKERYHLALMQLVKRYLSLELHGSTDKRWNAVQIRQLASEGYFTEDHRPREQRMFLSKDAFVQWVYDNHLDDNDGLPLWEGDLLPIKANFLQDFYSLCRACVQYSYGRTSYMPGACRDFIWKNIALFSDDGVRQIADEIDFRLDQFPMNFDNADHEETDSWRRYSRQLRRELLSREWSIKAQVLVQLEYDQYEDKIHRILAAVNDTEDEWIETWYQLDGIYRYLHSKDCSADKTEYKRLIRWAKRFAAKKANEIWEKEEGWKYIKVGPNLYMRRKDVENEKDTNAVSQGI